MVKRHMKRLLAPKHWRVPKKVKKWIVRPRPGPHKLLESIPLLVVVRDLLKLADSGKEAKAIVKKRQVIVDGRVRIDHKYGVGMMDVISVPELKLHYRVVPSAKGLQLVKIPAAEAAKKICRINNKTTVREGLTQLNLHDGRSLLVEKDVYKTGDSVLIELPSQKILQHVKFEKGSLALITKGKNAGKLARINEIFVAKKKEPAKTVCEIAADKAKVEVLKDYLLVVGKAKPLVKLGE